ncbi:hypothetical protein [Pseudomonas sp.]|uniref:hypothetical protein n=1 Tax=Pseudomonas sp. TaxID=306 RepID=UPI002731FB48|nr:hypothetical protein [Pseudomonas sp.]MDP2447632.1 hypothetical protein [Pseudomonas sp.]MDZ4334293.1 hypothetical protein [Pseudomonas sp.]
MSNQPCVPDCQRAGCFHAELRKAHELGRAVFQGDQAQLDAVEYMVALMGVVLSNALGDLSRCCSPVTACEHQYMWFGCQVKRRCWKCAQVEPEQQQAVGIDSEGGSHD